MDYEEKYEAEIDLSDLLPYILFKWRSIIAVGFIFAVLLGSYKIFRDLQSQSDGVQSKEFREYEIALAEYQLAETTYERNITDFQVRLTQQETYMEKSVFDASGSLREAYRIRRYILEAGRNGMGYFAR